MSIFIYHLLKKSSNPHNVPSISLLSRIKIHILEPIHLSNNSRGRIVVIYINIILWDNVSAKIVNCLKQMKL